MSDDFVLACLSESGDCVGSAAQELNVRLTL